MAFTIPVAVTSIVLAPTILPVFAVAVTAQLDAMVNEDGSTTVTVKVPLIVGVKVPPETPEMVTLSLVASPCGVTVVTRQGLLH